MFKIGLLVFLGFYSCIALGQTTPSYLTYRYASGILNPAYTGATERNVASFVFDRQVLGTDKDPMTYHLNYTHQIKEKIGLGISFSNTKMNIQNFLSVALDAAYRLKINQDTDFYFGAKAGFENFNNRLSDLGVSGDAALEGNDVNEWFTLMGFGGYLKNERYFLGFSVPNVLADQKFRKENGESVQVLPNRHSFYMNGGYHFSKGNILITPQLWMAYESSLANPFLIESSVRVNINRRWEFTAGYGSQKKMMLAIGLRFGGKIRFAYAFDYFLSGFSNIHKGIHGFMLQGFF